MKIESMSAWDEYGQGYAVKIDGENIFEYYNYTDSPEDSILERSHADVMSIPEMIEKIYNMGAENGKTDIVHEHYEVDSMDELYDWR